MKIYKYYEMSYLASLIKSFGRRFPKYKEDNAISKYKSRRVDIYTKLRKWLAKALLEKEMI